MEAVYNKDFIYRHNNPYHKRLEEFDSFVLRDREGESLMGKWGSVFEKKGPLYVEIGPGHGHFMKVFSALNPDVNFVGIDYRFKRSFYLAKKLKKLNLNNFRLLRARAERLGFLFDKNEVDSLFCFFPDPWPKERHHKRRILQGPFFKMAWRILKPKGKIYIKTDHNDYASWIEEKIPDKMFEVELATHNLWTEYSEHFLTRIATKFERIFLKQNLPINAYVLQKKEFDPCLI